MTLLELSPAKQFAILTATFIPVGIVLCILYFLYDVIPFLGVGMFSISLGIFCALGTKMTYGKAEEIVRFSEERKGINVTCIRCEATFKTKTMYDYVCDDCLKRRP